MKVFIKEIFSSIQGEGLNVGEKQLFIRFCGCNLKCAYCDTDYAKEDAFEYGEIELLNIINQYSNQTLSLTGGEPLLYKDFLKSFLPLTKRKIYLETNGTLYKELEETKSLFDVIAMDIKLQSATGQENRFEDNEKFLKVAPKKTFAKVVFNENITDNEIKNVIVLTKSVPLILQPEMPIKKDFDFEKIFDTFFALKSDVRLIPQTHKFLNVR